MSTNIAFRGLALLMGLSLVGVAAGLNVGHVLEGRIPQQASLEAIVRIAVTSPMALAIIMLALGSALAVLVMQGAWATGRKGLALLTLVGMIAGELFGFVLSAERLLSVREDQMRAITAYNQDHLTAGAQIKRAEAELREALRQETDEAKNGGCGSVCRALMAQTAAARQRLATAEAALTRLPVLRTTNHIAQMTGLPAIVVDVVPALAFSIALLLLGFCFIGFAHGSGQPVTPSSGRTRPVVTARPVGPLTREAAVADLLAILDEGGQVPEQRILAARWGVTSGCVSKWLADLEVRGVIRRERDGKTKAVTAA